MGSNKPGLKLKTNMIVLFVVCVASIMAFSATATAATVTFQGHAYLDNEAHPLDGVSISVTYGTSSERQYADAASLTGEMGYRFLLLLIAIYTGRVRI